MLSCDSSCIQVLVLNVTSQTSQIISLTKQISNAPLILFGPCVTALMNTLEIRAIIDEMECRPKHVFA